MEPRSAVGNLNLSFTPAILTSPPTGSTKTSANSDFYIWSWATFNGTTTYTPSNPGEYYGTTPIAPSSLPQPYSLYKVTLFDSNGNPIGSPQTVIDTTLPMTAQAGNTIIWPTLAQSTISSALTPGGALSGSEPALSVSWSALDNAAPLGPIVTQVQVQAGLGSTEVDGFWPGPGSYQSSGNYMETATAGMDEDGVQECTTTACPFPALTSGGYRTINLSWNARGINYVALHEYVD